MVSLTAFTVPDRLERVSQSVDYAIRDLLTEAEDPLALASYLWTYQQHKLTSINSKALIRWGKNWAHHVIIEHHVGARRDEEVASAALVISALCVDSTSPEIQHDFRNELSRLVGSELTKGPVPFKRSSYGSIVLLGVQRVGATEIPIDNSVKEISRQFREAIPGGRLFGLAYHAMLLRDLGKADDVDELARNVRTAFQIGIVNWEDQIYLLQSLWLLQRTVQPDRDLLALTEQCLVKSPVWGYLMNGTEDMPPAGDGRTIVKVSHLYKAALLDVLIRFQANREILIRERDFRRQQQVRGGVGAAAFGFYLILLSGAWFALLRLLVPSLRSGSRFWLSHDYDAMSKLGAVLFLAGIFACLYFAHLTVSIIPALYRGLVRLSVPSDQGMWSTLRPKLWRITRFWFFVALGGIILGFLINLLSPAVQHIFDHNTNSPRP